MDRCRYCDLKLDDSNKNLITISTDEGPITNCCAFCGEILRICFRKREKGLIGYEDSGSSINRVKSELIEEGWDAEKLRAKQEKELFCKQLH